MLRLTFRFEKSGQAAPAGPSVVETPVGASGSVTKSYVGFAIFGMIIIISGLVLIKLGNALAVHKWRIGERSFALGQTTVGTFLIAILTSLPELIVTLASLRLGSVDMALGNLFGSNMCNMAIAGLVNFAGRGGSIFAECEGSHAVTGIVGMTITTVAVAGLIYRSKKSLFYMGFDVIAMILLYVLGLIAIVAAGLG